MIATMILEGVAAAHLLFLAFATKTPNLRSVLVFRFPAAVLGTLLGARAFGAFMGWPV